MRNELINVRHFVCILYSLSGIIISNKILYFKFYNFVKIIFIITIKIYIMANIRVEIIYKHSKWFAG